MKILKHISVGAFAMISIIACNEGIDPISRVESGPDETAPTIKVNYPVEGGLIRVREDVTPINIQFEATDDIEVKSVVLTLDGTKIAELTDFKDYRRAIQEYHHNTLTNGIHTLTAIATDMSGKSSPAASVSFEKIAPYQPQYSGEIFYMPFDGDYLELVSITDATKVGSPSFSDNAKAGNSYAGALNSYLTLPTTGLLSKEFSAAFWYNINASPDRAGILVIGPPDPAAPDKPNNRINGFRFFREGSATSQNFALILGNGVSDNWFNGGAALSLDPATAGWVHMAFTISATECVIYFNGQVVKQGTFSGIDWTGCNILSIGSGAPRFTGWDHLSDQSNIDELRIFNKALTQEEVQATME